ncbi:TonB-dependent receptor domain-containing protein [Pedobacter sp. BMA]|uniref:TonB-dependent receptor n=1 Tax=Pedobacter sp. BMA TaxID=1663685 RepID=UPI00064A1780|nr:TonB-dependent receptor [Pedobacter sp. BMA]KLT67249.1 TonB-dependent receptor [Pedobacter sp. BMA]
MKKSLLLRFVLVIVALVGITIGASAQVTTSSMTGTIKDAKGALPGASIKATHTPTGSVYTAMSNNAGRFTIGNMRVGGPYVIEITYIGFQPKKISDAYLKLGETFLVDAELSDNTATLNEVVVRGQNNPIMNSKHNGAATNVSRAQIENLPTISRSVNDLTRLTPQANGTSIGGGSYRSNNFTVDGANFNNQFGIGQNIPANGSPISIDALEEISINVTPFDVRQSGFTGASINAVTRSGKNNFFGNAFYTFRSEKQQGVRVEDNVISNIQQLDEKQFGFSLGGPIIKNKLFFFVNMERKKTVEPGPTKVASTNGVENATLNIARPSVAFMDEVRQTLLSRYGYETGPYQGYSNESNNNKLFARLDWNISDKHKFNIRYSQVESKSPSSLSTSTSGSGFTANDNRQSIYAMSFQNSNYFQEANLYSGTAELNSNLGKFNNSLRASFAHQNDPRSSPGSEFPLVDILDKGLSSPRTGPNSTLVSFGYEPFTFGNLRDVMTYTFNDDLTFTSGKHNFTVGVQAEMSKTKNGFQRFGTGYYVYNSWNDFLTNAKPANFALTYPLTADGSQAFPSFKFFQLSAYGQDEFAVSDKLKLTLGLRLELPTYPDVSEVKTHPLVAAATFNGGTKINTGELPKSRLMFSPRVGFNYDILGDRSLQLRGGSGLFTGRIPFVWLVAQSGDAGMLQFTQSITNSTDPNMPNFNPNYKALYPATLPVAGTSIPGNISAMSPDLKFPQQWKSSLGLDAKLPFGFIGTIELIYGKDINAVVAQNVNLVDPQPLNVAGYPDNRFIYPATITTVGDPLRNVPLRYINRLTSAGQISSTGTSNFDATVMSNKKGGDYFSSSFQLAKPFARHWDMTAAYTYSYAKNYGDQSGDQIINLWSLPYQASGNSNDPQLSYTSNVVPHSVVASVSHKAEWIKGLETGMTLFYQGSSQGRYSYYYSNDFNRDNQVNDLMYIPRDASEITFVSNTTGGVTYTPAQQSEAFFKLVESDKYLRDNKGKVAQRNGAIAPWRNQFDFRFSQEIYAGKIEGHKNALTLYFDIFNVGNLINSKWGVYTINNNAPLAVANSAALVAGGTVKPTYRLNTINNQLISESNRINTTISSTYYMQFGVRYNFN